MSTPRFIPYRDRDLHAVLDLLAGGRCVAVIGLSNYGKSTLLRALQSPAVVDHYRTRVGHDTLFVYVDCNRMLELSPRGFYEATLRAVLEALSSDVPSLRARVEAQYRLVVAPPSDFAVPLAFNDALIELVRNNERRVVFLLDEFDEVLTGIEGRVLLNLRALRDQYGAALSYVIAVVRPLLLGRHDEHVAEFAEMFASGRHFLRPLADDETRQMAAELFVAAHDSLDPPEGDFLVSQAGGHPGLIQAVTRVLLQVESGAPELYQPQAFDLASAALEHDRAARSELVRLWSQLAADEQQAVIDLATMGRVSLQERELLAQRGLLRVGDDEAGSNAGANAAPGDEAVPGTLPSLFSELFVRFACRQALTRQSMPPGVWLDTDAGEVFVDGFPVPTLTDLEYRLLLLLYGRLDKICDKYQLVEAVWGEEYLDEVDDARIEKLVSRLRGKLEAHPGAARYLTTVRGRGYKLSSIPELIS